MNIAVVGAGAMGCLFGGKLSSIAQVWLVDPWSEHVDAINRGGLSLVELDGVERTIPVGAVGDARQVPGQAELALIFVKSHQTEWAARQAAAVLAGDGLALTLQNGLGNLEIIEGVVGKGRAVQGVTAHGATLLGPGRVRHAGKGETHLAGKAGGAREIEEIARLFNAAGFQTQVSDNLDGLVWEKLVINVGINALTAILRVPNGALAENPSSSELLRGAVEEAGAVAGAKSIPLPYADPVTRVLEVARATATNRSSMLQDVLRGAPTEIHVINGAIVREGERVGVRTPINRLLTQLVEAIETSYPSRVL